MTQSGARREVTGVILTGGKSRRLGQDKVLLPFRGSPLAIHLYNLLHSLFPRTILVGHPRPQLEAFGLPSVEDVVPDRGVLGGIYTALTTARTPYIFVLGADMPFVSRPLIEEIVALRGQAPAIVPRGPRGLEPLCALYSQACTEPIKRSMDQGNLKVLDALTGLKILSPALGQEEDAWDPFANINRPEDLVKLKI